MYFLFSIPFWVALYLFYSRERTKQLLKEYHQQYGEARKMNTLRILLYVVVPMIVAITMAVIRQGR